MEVFAYNKAWKAHKFMSCGYPALALLAILAYWVFLVSPSSNSAVRFEFKWWVPLFGLGLVVWLFLEVAKLRKILAFSVELSEEAIKVRGVEAKWVEVTRIESKSAHGDGFAIILHTTGGDALGIPAATDGFAYIKGFVEAHATRAERK